jgi:hypothetical protein
MVGVAVAIQSPPPSRRLEEHAISTRVWRSVSDAMLDRVNIHSWPLRANQALKSCTIHDLFNRERNLLRVLTLKQCRRNPYFVRDFYLKPRHNSHSDLLNNLFLSIPILLGNKVMSKQFD